ncbi:MAG: gliding motility-associated C-terminal domain-containing protein, partial [Bacteroidota bacterium]
DRDLCEGDSLLLFPDLSIGDFLWSDGSQEMGLFLEEDGIYWLEQDLGGCSFRDSVNIRFLPFPIIELGTDTTLCEGDILGVEVVPEPGVSYRWQDGQAGPSYAVGVSGLYALRATIGQCESEDSVRVDFVERPVFSLGPDTVFCTIDGEMSLLPILPDYQSLVWSDGSDGPLLVIEEGGEYWLEITTEVCGTLRDSVSVTEYPCLCPLFFASAFSPNGDGQNEAFGAAGICQPIDYELQIFNRWGQALFETQIPTQQWDGRFNGQAVPEGVYVWVARYGFRDRGGWRETFQRGTVTLIR